MARTRIFVSSTSDDLSALRSSIREMVREFGHDPIAFEQSDFSANPAKDTLEACLTEVRRADILIMVLDRRYGTKHKGKSFTRWEYEAARAAQIPTYVLVSKDTMIGRRFYIENGRDPKGKWGVDDPDIFEFIDEIRAQERGNWIKEYTWADDVKDWIKGQLSSLLHDFIVDRARPEQQPSSTARRIKAIKRSPEPGQENAQLLHAFSRMSFSYKPVLFLTLWERKDTTGTMTLETLMGNIRQFYLDRKQRGETVEYPPSELQDPSSVSDAALMRLLWDGPIEALRGRLVETEGSGPLARVRLTDKVLSASSTVQIALVANAQSALTKYYSR